MLKAQTYSLLFVVLIAFGLADMVNAQPQRAYERGLEELYRGNTAQALDIWYEAYNAENGVDARIGFEFIRVVTEQKRTNYYAQATELYYRALVDAAGIDSRVAIRQEINRLRPIIGEGIYRQWVNWWEQENRNLGSDMRGFWVQQDPTPSQISNERLIEHWERISESKRRFTRNSRTVYGTDDRALIYIRYGEPDRRQNGIFTLQSLNMRNWLLRQLNPYTGDYPEEMTRDDSNMQMVEDQRMIDRLQDAIYEFHRYPEYEVWFYDNLDTESRSSIPFIFGTDVNTDTFKLQSSIEDFIPERAYHPERVRQQEGVEFTRAGITPALMLQLLYYEQLVQVDPFFNERLNSLQDNVLEQGLQAFQGMDLAFKAESRELINQRTVRAPVEKSEYTSRIAGIPLSVYQYRFLDEEGEPYVLTYLESSAQESFLIDYHRNSVGEQNDRELVYGENILTVFPFYELNHTLIEYDNSWNIKEAKKDKPSLILTRSSSGNVSRSVFVNRHTGRTNFSATVELMNYDPDTRTVFDTPFSHALRGLGSSQFRIQRPLVSHADSLEMGDLILGFEEENQQTYPFNFVVANDEVVPVDKTLVLHFEVYNLKRKTDVTEFTEFDLTYRILPVDEQGMTRDDQSEFVLTLNFINEDRNVIEDLEIETADLQPGLYDLRVQVVDLVANQEKHRRLRFEVVE